MNSKSSNEKANVDQLRIWSAFLYFDYRVLWFSTVTATATMNLRMIITAIWLYERTGQGSTLAWLGLIELAVRLPANLYGGVFADRVDRKKLIAFTQLFSLVLIGSMAILESTSSLEIWHVYLVSGILAASSVFGGPARSAFTARVVPRNVLGHAVAMNTITWQIGTIVTPLIILLNTGDSGSESLILSFWINTFLAFISVISPLFIKESGRALDITKSESVNKNIVEGFKYIKSHPILPGLYILDIGVTVVSYYRELFPLFASKLYQGGRGAVVTLSIFNSVGAILGSLLVVYTHKLKRKGVIVLYATLVYGFLLVIFGWSTSIYIGIFALVALGAADAVGMTMRQTVVQLTTPDNMRGRATAAHSLAAMTANGIGKWEVGIMSDFIGAGNTMVLGGVVSILVVLIIWYGLSGVRKYSYEEIGEVRIKT